MYACVGLSVCCVLCACRLVCPICLHMSVPAGVCVGATIARPPMVPVASEADITSPAPRGRAAAGGREEENIGHRWMDKKRGCPLPTH